jgi:hypothetical protein
LGASYSNISLDKFYVIAGLALGPRSLLSLPNTKKPPRFLHTPKELSVLRADVQLTIVAATVGAVDGPSGTSRLRLGTSSSAVASASEPNRVGGLPLMRPRFGRSSVRAVFKGVWE